MFVIDTDKECLDPTCSEEPVDQVFMKFTFYYEDATPAMRDIESAACCDVTSTQQGDANVEYDLPPCAPGTPANLCACGGDTAATCLFQETSTVTMEPVEGFSSGRPRLRSSSHARCRHVVGAD